MVKGSTSTEWVAERAVDVRELRGQAGELLERLKASRSLSEQRAAETGRRDPIKSITGRSALESAIATTRGMIDEMDQLLAEFGGESEHDSKRNGSRSRARELAVIGSAP